MELKRTKGAFKLRDAARNINPEDYILSVLSPEDRLDAAFKAAGEACKKTKLTMDDVESVVRVVKSRLS